MKNIAMYLILLCCAGWFSNVLAQNRVGPVVIDKSFATNGKTEVDFSGYDAEATCYVAYKTSPIIVGGFRRTSSFGSLQFAILRCSSTGVPDETFGLHGQANLSWTGVEYPMALSLFPNGAILAAGVSVKSDDYLAPTLFRIKSNGTADSSFGTDGHVQAPFDTLYEGWFLSLDTERVRVGTQSPMRFVGCGYYTTSNESASGFFAARFDSTGVIDTSFGTGGTIKFPTPLINPAIGRVMHGQKVLMAALTISSPYPELLLGRLTANGLPDSSFGTNGLINTHIALQGQVTQSSLLMGTPTDSTMIFALPLEAPASNIPFTMMQFKLDGSLDSSYGVNGFASSSLTSVVRPQGLNISNDGSALISGSTDTGIGLSVVTKFFPAGRIDTLFGVEGVALVDPDSGQRRNVQIAFVPASMGGKQQKLIGIGNTYVSDTVRDFFVARYLPISDLAVDVPTVVLPTMQLNPNPARSIVQVGQSGERILRIDVMDVLGRIVSTVASPKLEMSDYSLDVSALTNGIYVCRIESDAGVASQRFTVEH